jgi:hypothetical protein
MGGYPRRSNRPTLVCLTAQRGLSGALDNTHSSGDPDGVEPEHDLWNEWRRLLRQQSPDPLEVAKLASTFERYFDAVKTEAVKAARAAGVSWEEIATSLGTSRQSAWERYRRAESIRKSRWWPVPLQHDPRP